MEFAILKYGVLAVLAFLAGLWFYKPSDPPRVKPHLGYAALGKPGSAYGPCPVCKHEICQEARDLADSRCHLCGARIGYDAMFARDELGPVHVDCLDPRELIESHALDEEAK